MKTKEINFLEELIGASLICDLPKNCHDERVRDKTITREIN